MNEVTISRSEYSRLKEECRLCSASHDEQQLDIQELAEALDRCVLYTKQFAHLSLNDQEKYQSLANKHKKGENNDSL